MSMSTLWKYSKESSAQVFTIHPLTTLCRLTWFMPGGNTLVVHMKDRKKSRIKKRWSQVMYMYFLLGFRLMGRFQSKLLENITQDKRGRTKKAISREDGMFFKVVEWSGAELST